MKFQRENSKLRDELLKCQSQREENHLKYQNENSKLIEENLTLTKYIKDLKLNSSKIEQSLKIECKRAENLELELNNLKSKQGSIEENELNEKINNSKQFFNQRNGYSCMFCDLRFSGYKVKNDHERTQHGVTLKYTLPYSK